MTASSATTIILRGQTLAFRGDPFAVEPDAAVEHHVDGAEIPICRFEACLVQAKRYRC
jgi:hypothetical protein